MAIVDERTRPRRLEPRLQPRRAPRAAKEIIESRWLVPIGLPLLVLLSLFLRSRQLHAGFWIDEGISVGISHEHWTSIPHLLREDGSPPLYYMLLGVWVRLFGDSEAATHTLSLVFGLACVPLAYFAARAVFGRRAGLAAAVIAALDPFLTYYAQETRMYELEALLSVVVAWSYVEGILRGRRSWTPVFVVSTALLAYSHNWGLFLCFGLAVATFAFARERLRLFGIAAAGVAVLYAPWLPTLLSQVRHTGAPWSTRPSFHDLFLSAGSVIGGDAPYVALVLVGGAALGGIVLHERTQERREIAALLTVVAVTVVVAFVASQISPAWTARYFAVIFGPVVLVAGHAIVRARGLGIATLAALVFLFAGYSVKNDKENAKGITAGTLPYLKTGDLIISTHPEQVPVLRYYLGPGYRWATTLGKMPDPLIFDWRDAVSRLKAAKEQPTIDELLATVPPGGTFVVFEPVFRDYRAWRAQWTKLVWRKASDWSWLLEHDPRLQLVAHIRSDEIALKKNYFKPLQAFVYRRKR
ncbi:MAG TPA: glycosyltransferase family 39 protein [Gaiellaceae bacterium]|nr:glycosyltransferase family 39 protein [Gaiellaceae bacterium]